MKNITGSEILPVIQKCQELKAHYRYSDNKLLESLMQWYICSFAGWSGAEIKCTIHLAMPKRPINQFEMNQQSRQLALRAFCPNIYTVPVFDSFVWWIVMAGLAQMPQIQLSRVTINTHLTRLKRKSGCQYRRGLPKVDF